MSEQELDVIGGSSFEIIDLCEEIISLFIKILGEFRFYEKITKETAWKKVDINTFKNKVEKLLKKISDHIGNIKKSLNKII